ncbi:MAG TPA: Type 1 glutamine amidotransferase-like domain-containing protein [Anaerolineales bacterium]|nr:Type 1 glutamine amidotransferase-like domain-containing protein [Anaerolineales bacterium]
MIALVGAGEFLESMRPIDAELLRRAGGRRVALLPTASAPDGPGVPQRWAAMGEDHFRALGADPAAVMALDRTGCQAGEHVDLVRQADLVYFSGGKPGYLLHTLRGTPLWEAVLGVLSRGGVLAGCSAGAMILGEWIPDHLSLRHPPFWKPAFGLVPGAMVLPHFDELPAWVGGVLWALRPRQSHLIGVDGGTALVGDADGWGILGPGRVTVRTRAGAASYAAGQAVQILE